MSPGAGRVVQLVRASHPEPVIAVSALTGVLAAGAGRGSGSFWVLAAVFSGQLFVGWTNDLLDAGLDASQGRTDKPVATGGISRAAVRNAAALAGLACIPLSLASGLLAGLVHLAAVAAATLYNLRLKVTAASVAPYALSFGLLPAFVTLGLPGHPWPAPWVIGAGALLGSGAHFTQSLPDVRADLEQGLAGLPARLGERWSARAAAGLLLGAVFLISFGPGPPSMVALAGLAISGLLSAVVVVLADRGRPLAAFRITILLAAVAVGSLIVSGPPLLSR